MKIYVLGIKKRNDNETSTRGPTDPTSNLPPSILPVNTPTIHAKNHPNTRKISTKLAWENGALDLRIGICEGVSQNRLGWNANTNLYGVVLSTVNPWDWVPAISLCEKGPLMESAQNLRNHLRLDSNHPDECLVPKYIPIAWFREVGVLHFKNV